MRVVLSWGGDSLIESPGLPRFSSCTKCLCSSIFLLHLSSVIILPNQLIVGTFCLSSVALVKRTLLLTRILFVSYSHSLHGELLTGSQQLIIMYLFVSNVCKQHGICLIAHVSNNQINLGMPCIRWLSTAGSMMKHYTDFLTSSELSIKGLHVVYFHYMNAVMTHLFITTIFSHCNRKLNFYMYLWFIVLLTGRISFHDYRKQEQWTDNFSFYLCICKD